MRPIRRKIKRGLRPIVKRIDRHAVRFQADHKEHRDTLAKTIIHNNCNGCHTPSYPLQFKFDQQGWTRIIDLMKVIGGGGVPLDRPANQIIQMNEKLVASYLAKVRGPDSVVQIKDRPRPSGEATRAVWTLYDVPRVQGAGAGSLGLAKATT